MGKCINDKLSNRIPRSNTDWVCPKTSLKCPSGYTYLKEERSKSHGPNVCFGDAFDKVERKRFICVPKATNKSIYPILKDVLYACCTGSKVPRYKTIIPCKVARQSRTVKTSDCKDGKLLTSDQCKPGYCLNSDKCQDIVLNHCSINNKFITDDTCNTWSKSNVELTNPIFSNYCSKVHKNKKSNLLKYTRCSDWCNENPIECDKVINKTCTNYPKLNECKCYNAKNQSEYKELMKKDHSGVLSQYSPYCLYSKCRSGKNIVDTLLTQDLKKTIDNCPVADIEQQIINIEDSQNVTLTDIDQTIKSDKKSTTKSTDTDSTDTDSTLLNSKNILLMFIFLIIIIIVIIIAFKISYSNSSHQNTL